jgi:hypothetical protein
MIEPKRVGRWGALLLLVAGTCVCGCKSTDSTDVKTSEIWAFYTAEQTADGQVTVDGTFKEGGVLGTPIRLVEGEHIEVNGVKPAKLTTEVTLDPAPDGLYQVVLVRTDERISSTIQMPEAPTILALDPPDGVVKHGGELTITWDVSAPVEGPNLEVRVDGPCFTGQHVLAHDTGEFTTKRLQGHAQYDGCEIEITLIRKEGRRVNSKFDGGSAEGYRYIRAKGQLLGI